MPRGQGYWKLINALLQDKNYVEQMKKCITEFLAYNPASETNLRVCCDALKCFVRGETVRHAATSKKKRLAMQKILNKKS